MFSGHMSVTQMPLSPGKLGLALVLAALCLGGRALHAQSAPVSYWIPGWPLGFGGGLPSVPAGDTYRNFPSFDGSGAQAGGFSYSRYNFPNGWFVGSEGGRLGLNASGIGPDAFGGPFSSQGMQFGYNFKNSGGLPISVYGGFDTLKYNSGIGGPFSAFDSTSGTLPGYSVHAGVEFQATSNISLSLGAGYTQQSGNTDINSLVLPGASPFAGRH